VVYLKLDYLDVLEKEIISLDNPTKVFSLVDYKKHLKREDSGNYVFFNELNDEVLYVGVSIEIKKRMNAHMTYWGSCSSLCCNLLRKLGDKEKVLDFIKNVKVMFWRESDEFKQDFFEKYLICVLKPIFNKKRATHSNVKKTFKLKKEHVNRLRVIEIKNELNERVFGDLKVIRIAKKNDGEDAFLLNCSCGSIVRYERRDLLDGKILSCRGLNKGRHVIV